MTMHDGLSCNVTAVHPDVEPLDRRVSFEDLNSQIV